MENILRPVAATLGNDAFASGLEGEISVVVEIIAVVQTGMIAVEMRQSDMDSPAVQRREVHTRSIPARPIVKVADVARPLEEVFGYEIIVKTPRQRVARRIGNIQHETGFAVGQPQRLSKSIVKN